MKQLKVSKIIKFQYVLIPLFFLFPTINGFSAVPLVLNYQGNVEDNLGTPVNGTGFFKFAMVNQAGDTAYWVNDGTTLDGSEPPNAVSTAVSDGVFSIKLGDTSLANMAALTPSVFDNDMLYLRVWFSTDALNFEQFTSDIQIVSAGFAIKAAVADTVVDSAVTSINIQDNSITNVDISGTAAIAASKIDTTGLDADTLDGSNSTDFAQTAHTHGDAEISDVTWGKITSVPAGFADGVDNGITSETDPQVGSLTSGRWCTSNGSTVNCTSLAPSGGLWTQSGSDIYYSDGDVGIGTTAPTEPLSIITLNDTFGAVVEADYQIGGFAGIGFRKYNLLGNVPIKSGVVAEQTNTFGRSDLVFLVSNDANFNDANISHERMRITGLGFVGINNPTPNVSLDVIGNIEYTGTITDVSDERLKENILPIYNALEKVLAVNGVSYNMIDTPDKREIGVIAQNIQSVLPEAVSIADPNNGYLGVSYPSIIPVLIEAIKEQQKQLDELRQRLNEMQ